MEFEPVRLSTAELPERDRDELIREFYGKIAQRMELGLQPGQRPEIDVAAHMLPAMHLGGGVIGNMWAHRTAAMRSDGGSDIVLSFALDGSVVRERGRPDVEVAPGDAILTSLDRPISLYMPTKRSRILTVQVERAALAPLVPRLDDRLTGSIAAGPAAMQLLRGYAETVRAVSPRSPELRAAAARHLIQLTALAIGATADARGLALRGGVPAARLADAKARILRQLDAPGLSAATVSRQMGVSTRYLHKLFETDVSSFAGFVARGRLERAAAMLTDPAGRGRRIIDIALDSGFADVRTFNRAFRRHFGCTPSEARGEGRAALRR